MRLGSICTTVLRYVLRHDHKTAVVAAVLTGRQRNELIAVFGGHAGIIETLSDILQVSYFKLTHGKRIFKMAPIHHHFEMCGWSEKKIWVVFVSVTVIMCVIAWFGVRIWF